MASSKAKSTQGIEIRLMLIEISKHYKNSILAEFEFNLRVCNIHFQGTGMIKGKMLVMLTKEFGSQ